jgi:uroporphyrinogen-III decarboxylase
MVMKSRDLTLAAIEGTAEKVPFNPFIMHLAAAISGFDYSNRYCKDASVLAESQIKCAELFRVDHVNVSTDAFREASAWGVEIDYSSHTPVAKTYLSLEDFPSLDEPDLMVSDRIQNRVDAIRILKKKAGNEQCIVGWIEAPFAEVCCLFGLMNVLKLARSSNWNAIIHDIIKRLLPTQLEFAEMQIEAGADIVGVGDSAVSQIGPKRYQEACLTPTKELFKTIQKHVPVLYHVCGDSSVVDSEGRDMLKLVASSGAAVLDIDFQVEMISAKEKIGTDVCIRGNTSTSLLGSSNYDVTKVENEITQTILAGMPGGKYMWAAGCEIPWAPIETITRNLKIARAVVDKIGGY